MSNPKFSIIDRGTKCALNCVDIHFATNLPLPIQADDAKALILAAFKAADHQPRRELHGVLADKMTFGVRVRVVGQDAHFDLPWSIIAQDAIEIMEQA
ncbi:hypothetical protein [Roseovarius sp. MBR-6]|jgi:hypothetical protein|uniref:hypothetical protein n=1 Tax=Roseovarius sp. MBR-6 TaxID=3156459 RepID=UPI0033914AA6